METTIRNKGGESTEIIKIDFFQLLDENFNEVRKASIKKIPDKIKTNIVRLLKIKAGLFKTKKNAIFAV